MTQSAPFPIMLRREGDYAVVEIDTGVPNKDGSRWVEVIRERLDGNFSHIVEPGGIEGAIHRHYNARATLSSIKETGHD